MFGSLIPMVGTYESRKVDNFRKEGLHVDTVLVTDSDQPYETGIIHPKYNDGEWIIVEMYDSKEEAQKGHDRWVLKMTAKVLPEFLKDVSTCGIKKIIDSFNEGEMICQKTK